MPPLGDKQAWLDALLQDNLPWVMPEVVLVIAMCAVIIVPFFKRSVMATVITTVVGLLLTLVFTLWTLSRVDDGVGVTVFSGMVTVDYFSQFFKILLVIFAMLIILQWSILGRSATHEGDTPDYLCLLLGAVTGMSLMASADNLLMVLMATEAASLPSFALAGFRKRHLLSTEGSLKYVLFGAASSAVMIYGMSLVYGMTGTLSMADVAVRASTQMSPLLAVGLLAMFAGFAFKLSAVPLHFWCPDVFQGAPIEITTFLSVASKGAAVCMLVRALAHFGDAGTFPGMVICVALLGSATAFWGNLVALQQTNIKRLLAYSSIAHAGYMILAAAVLPATEVSDKVAAAILFYLFVYTFMNLGAFTIAALIARQTGSENIADYTGMSRRSPLLAFLLGAMLLSLFGMPGLGGFIGKIALLSAMESLGNWGFALVAVLLFNTLQSLYYYLKPVYYMYLVQDDVERPAVTPGMPATALLAVCTLMLLITGIVPPAVQSLTEPYGKIHAVSKAAAVPAEDAIDTIEPGDASPDTEADVDSESLSRAESSLPASDLPVQ